MSFPTFVNPDKSPVTGDVLTFVSEKHAGTKNWIQNIMTNFVGNSKFQVSPEVVVHAIKPFGPLKRQDGSIAPAGFVFAEATIKQKVPDPKTGNPVDTIIPGVAFLRGGAVAVLVILKVQETGEDLCLLTVQSRVPIGHPAYEEIPAGMIDGASNFIGVAAKEMKEETGIEIQQSQLMPLGKMIPSAGGCDEFINLYLFKDVITAEKAVELKGKATGNLAENENIILNLQPLSVIQERIRAGELTDAKLLSALYHYFSIGGPSMELSYEPSSSGGARRRGRKTRRKTHRKH